MLPCCRCGLHMDSHLLQSKYGHVKYACDYRTCQVLLDLMPLFQFMTTFYFLVLISQATFYFWIQLAASPRPAATTLWPVVATLQPAAGGKSWQKVVHEKLHHRACRLTWYRCTTNGIVDAHYWWDGSFTYLFSFSNSFTGGATCMSYYKRATEIQTFYLHMMNQVSHHCATASSNDLCPHRHDNNPI